MTKKSINNWVGIQTEVLERIHSRTWKPGETIPKEIELANEFGCSRVTVNRALRTLADRGILERKRKIGTRVALYPTSNAIFKISLIRKEIENQGNIYDYKLIKPYPVVSKKQREIPGQIKDNSQIVFVRALHQSNKTPFVVEDRWINTAVVPNAIDQSFEKFSPNEWLLENVPYTHGEFSFSAINCSMENSSLLNINKGNAVFQIERTTFDRDQVITNVLLTYHKDYRLEATL